MTQHTIRVREETYSRLKLTSLTAAFPDGKEADEPGWIILPVGQRSVNLLSTVQVSEGLSSDDEAMNHLIDKAINRAISTL